MDDVLARIQSAFNNAFGTDSSLITIEATPDQIPGWDSLGHAVLTIKLEEEFGCSFEIDELMAMENVKEIYNIIKSKSLE